MKLINALEAFSTYFTKGIADEEIAFSSVGRTFCVNVGYIYFDFATFINEGDSSFQNVIALFKMWNDRLEKEQLLNKIDSLKDERINPLGAK